MDHLICGRGKKSPRTPHNNKELFSIIQEITLKIAPGMFAEILSETISKVSPGTLPLISNGFLPNNNSNDTFQNSTKDNKAITSVLGSLL